jgi:hypothetical protein
VQVRVVKLCRVAKAQQRRPLNTSVSVAGHRKLTERARDETDGNVSELVRRMLKYGMAHMPAGYR